jgi:hypothetical protein
VNRSDVVSAGACSNINNGFSVGLTPVAFSQGGTNNFLVYWVGAFGPTQLEGPTQATIVY